MTLDLIEAKSKGKRINVQLCADCPLEGKAGAGRFRMEIMGRPVLKKDGRPVYLCRRHHQAALDIWDGALKKVKV